MSRIDRFAVLAAAILAGGCSLFQDEPAPATAPAGAEAGVTSIAGAPRAGGTTWTTPGPEGYPVRSLDGTPPPPPPPSDEAAPTWTPPAPPPVQIEPGDGSGSACGGSGSACGGRG